MKSSQVKQFSLETRNSNKMSLTMHGIFIQIFKLDKTHEH